MKMWHKLRNSVYFVDVLLLIGATIAIIGLATFVRLHNSNKPKEISQKGILSVNVGHLDTLDSEVGSQDNAQNPSTSTQNSGPAENSSSQLQSTVSAPEVSSPAAACGVDCDSIEITTPEIKTPVVPITLPPVKLPVKPCDGVIKRAADAVLNRSSDQLQCPL